MNTKLLITLALCAGLFASARHLKDNTALLADDSWVFPDTIKTTDGDTFYGVSLIRSEPDGYLVNYHPNNGGVGVAKIKFARLSAEMQKRSGYNPEEARDFETQVANASTDLDQQRLIWAQADAADNQARQGRIDQEAQVAVDRASALADMEQVQANVAVAAQSGGNYGLVRANGHITYAIPADFHYVKTGFQPASGAAAFGTMTPYRTPHR